MGAGSPGEGGGHTTPDARAGDLGQALRRRQPKGFPCETTSPMGGVIRAMGLYRNWRNGDTVARSARRFVQFRPPTTFLYTSQPRPTATRFSKTASSSHGPVVIRPRWESGEIH
jgi:hypothetical protein